MAQSIDGCIEKASHNGLLKASSSRSQGMDDVYFLDRRGRRVYRRTWATADRK